MCNANASERDLFKNFGEAFCAGFSDVAPAGYSEEADMQTDAPWCAPWEWADFDEWFFHWLSPYEMGREWAKKNYDELESLL